MAEIRRQQKSGELLCSKLCFKREIKIITNEICGNARPKRYQKEAILALQEAGENHLVSIFQDSVLTQIHAKRKTLQVKDMQFVKDVRPDTKFNGGPPSFY